MQLTGCGASHATRCGALRALISRARRTTRYELQDLSVTEVLPQQVALSECFIQIYERV